MAKKILVAFDFDNTVVAEDADLYIAKLAPGGTIPQEILEKFRYIHIQSLLCIQFGESET